MQACPPCEYPVRKTWPLSIKFKLSATNSRAALIMSSVAVASDSPCTYGCNPGPSPIPK